MLLRPYANGDYFVKLASDQLDGASCTVTYKVKGVAAGAKAVIASLLTAYALPKKIQLETDPCTGYGTLIKSVFLQP